MSAVFSVQGWRECAASATGAEKKRFVLSCTVAFMSALLLNGTAGPGYVLNPLSSDM